MLKHFVSKAVEVALAVGVRLVVVHAKDDEAKSFYEHFGFVASPFDPHKLIMLLSRQQPVIDSQSFPVPGQKGLLAQAPPSEAPARSGRCWRSSSTGAKRSPRRSTRSST